jgi:ketosteroid isomerase-like protein
MGLLAALGDHWQTIACNELQFIAQDDWVLAVFRLQATARNTGREADQRIAELWRLKDGKIVFLQPFYFDTHAIRKVFGMFVD